MIRLHARPHPSHQKAGPATHRKIEKERQFAVERRGRRGWAWSRIIRPQESLVLYKIIQSSLVPQKEFLQRERRQRCRICSYFKGRGGEYYMYIESRLDCDVCTLETVIALWHIRCLPLPVQHPPPPPIQLPAGAQTEADNDKLNLFLRRRHFYLP